MNNNDDDDDDDDDNNNNNNDDDDDDDDDNNNNNAIAFTCFPACQGRKYTLVSKIDVESGKGKKLTFKYNVGKSLSDDKVS